MARVCVVGAGIMGLSTAYQILEAIPGVDLTIIAEDFPPHTSSNASGGYVVMAYFNKHDITKDFAANRARRNATFDHCQKLYFSEEVEETGVQLVNFYRIAKIEEKPDDFKPVDDDRYHGFRKMTPNELAMFPEYRKGYSYLTYVINQRKYLPWLMKKVQEKGVKMRKSKLSHLGEVADDFDVIVNCSGTGARDLANDKEVTKARGHTLVVKAPWLKIAVFEPATHMLILPMNDHAFIGATWHANDLDPEPRRSDREHLLKSCSEIFPAMKDVEVVEELIGWRPVRESLERVEKEEIKHNGRTFPVIHNYGHGKQGVTLHWGSAIEAAKLVKETLKTNQRLSKL